MSIKAVRQKPTELLIPLLVSKQKWEDITMDYVIGFLRTMKENNSIWVIVDRLTKSAHFIPIKNTYSMDQMDVTYVKENFRLHGGPVSITSDRDSRFISRFQQSVQKAMGTKLNLSSAFHPQNDGKPERTIQMLEDLPRVCAMEFQGSWKGHLSLIEFKYNNNYQTSIDMAPFEHYTIKSVGYRLAGQKLERQNLWDQILSRKPQRKSK